MRVHRGQGVAPDVAIPGVGKTCKHARLGGFFVLQQQVGHTPVGRHHQDPAVGIRMRADDVVTHGGIIVHRGTANFFNGMRHGVNSPSLSRNPGNPGAGGAGWAAARIPGKQVALDRFNRT